MWFIEVHYLVHYLNMSKSQNLATILKRPETSYGTLIQVVLAYHPKNPHYLHKIINFTNIFIIYNKNHLHIHKHLHYQQKHPHYPEKTLDIFTNILLTSQTSTPSLQTSPLKSQASLSFHFSVSVTFLGCLGGLPVGQSLGFCFHWHGAHTSW